MGVRTPGWRPVRLWIPLRTPVDRGPRDQLASDRRVYRQTCNGQPGAPKRAALLISFGACAWIEASGGPDMCAGRVERGFEVVEAAFAEVVRTQPGTGAARSEERRVGKECR